MSGHTSNNKTTSCLSSSFNSAIPDVDIDDDATSRRPQHDDRTHGAIAVETRPTTNNGVPASSDLQPFGSSVRLDVKVDTNSNTTETGLIPPSTTIGNNNNNMAVSVPESMVEKRWFLIFIKILFKSLDQSDDVSLETREAARAIVADCTRRNRLGDPNYRPLMEAVDQRLRRHIGERHWRKAHFYLQHFRSREAARSRLPVPLKTAAV